MKRGEAKKPTALTVQRFNVVTGATRSLADAMFQFPHAQRREQERFCASQGPHRGHFALAIWRSGRSAFGARTASSVRFRFANAPGC